MPSEGEVSRVEIFIGALPGSCPGARRGRSRPRGAPKGLGRLRPGPGARVELRGAPLGAQRPPKAARARTLRGGGGVCEAARFDAAAHQ